MDRSSSTNYSIVTAGFRAVHHLTVGLSFKIVINDFAATEGQGTKRRRNIAENFNRLSRVHERYRRQTDQRPRPRWLTLFIYDLCHVAQMIMRACTIFPFT